MAISERELKENEAKIDNILHKILESSRQIQDLRDRVNLNMPEAYNNPLLDEIGTLGRIIEELATLADEIDVSDERLTERAEGEIKDKLDEAIARILAIKTMFKEE
jgi:hypothetical protein